MPNDNPPAEAQKNCEAVNTGCTWNAGALCQLKPKSKAIDPNPCVALQQSACTTADCQWFPNGACLKSLDQVGIDCSTHKDSTSCTNRDCYWSSGTCVRAKQVGDKCSNHNECGTINYCSKPLAGDNVCAARITDGINCYGKSPFGKIDDRVCTDKKYCAFDSFKTDFDWETIASNWVLPDESMFANFFCRGSSVTVEYCVSEFQEVVNTVSFGISIPSIVCNKVLGK